MRFGQTLEVTSKLSIWWRWSKTTGNGIWSPLNRPRPCDERRELDYVQLWSPWTQQKPHISLVRWTTNELASRRIDWEDIQDNLLIPSILSLHTAPLQMLKTCIFLWSLLWDSFYFIFSPDKTKLFPDTRLYDGITDKWYTLEKWRDFLKVNQNGHKNEYYFESHR